jgi:hypothetical protein
MKVKKPLTYQQQLAQAAIKRIPRHISKKGQHYQYLVAEIKRKYRV